MQICIGEATVWVEGVDTPFGVWADDVDGNPLVIAWDATACSREAASSGVGDVEGPGNGCDAGAGVGRWNMRSIVGRNAAPKGVERKSEGRSTASCEMSLQRTLVMVTTGYP